MPPPTVVHNPPAHPAATKTTFASIGKYVIMRFSEKNFLYAYAYIKFFV